jgi:hypothetical protein
MLRKLALSAVLAVIASSAPAEARDWFVRAGAEGGDGSLEKPFADPWQPLEKCEAGDAIHVAEGEYTGKLNAGYWEVPFDDITLLGGYDKEFKERDPWKHHTRPTWKKEFKNWPKEPRISSNHKGTVVDGFVLDCREKNWYVDDKETGRDFVHPLGEEMLRFSQPATIRNCVIVNPGTYGIVCKQATTIENNLILNALGTGVKITSFPPANDLAKVPAVVRGNTILFCWDERAPGKGGYEGSAIAVGGPAVVSDNLLAYNDNHGVYCTTAPEKVTLSNNVFAMNLFSNFKFYLEGRDIAVDNASMGDLEDVGFKSCEGNEVVDPQLALDPRWLDMYSKRTAAQPGKLVMDDWNKLRRELGLPLIGTGGEAASGIAPAYDVARALDLLAPKNAEVKAGARVRKLEVKLSSPAAAAAAKSYEKVPLLEWHKQPAGVEGKAIEMLVAIGNVANIGGIPAQYKKDDHEGAFVYDPDGKGERVTAFWKKGTSAARVFQGAMGKYDGRGAPDAVFLARGVAHGTSWVPKAAFYVESIERFEAAAGAAARPQGRDWFVRAGAGGGNGSREKPFKDPFQALERCEAGDTIHVAEGTYTGKLKVGTWKVDTQHVALLGGYDKEFKERDPWGRPTLLVCPEDFKGRRGGYTIDAGADDTTGLVIDGFVFDKKLNNKYAQNGDLRQMDSDKTEHVWVSRPDCVVRNCVFVNGALGALRAANGQVIENNIFVNHMTQVVDVSSGFTSRPAQIRGNTFAFSWDKRFGQGMGSNGSFVNLTSRSRAEIDGNIFEFADNDALRVSEPKDQALTNNVFAHNLWSNVFNTGDTTFVDDKDFAKLCDIGWKKCEGNRVLIPGLPVDEKWFDTYLNRTAYVPGKVSMDDWNELRKLMGHPVVATGGKAAEGMAPAYDWKLALALFPKNEQCGAGARRKKLEVKFEGIVREEPKHEYEEVTWETAKSKDEWAKLEGKRVMIKVAIQSTDNSYYLDDVKEAEFTCFKALGPEGSESGGLPLRCYVKKGTRHDRAVRQAKGVMSSSKPEELHVAKGIARKDRQLVAEVVEKAE